MTDPRRAESEAESKQIAYAWYKFIEHMSCEDMIGSTDVKLSVTNGGYTMRHGLNPVIHTIIEDWYHAVPTHAIDHVAIGSTIVRGHDRNMA